MHTQDEGDHGRAKHVRLHSCRRPLVSICNGTKVHFAQEAEPTLAVVVEPAALIAWIDSCSRRGLQ